MKEKFYYIDVSGAKRKYVGHVIRNSDNSFTGFLTKVNNIPTVKDLDFHEEVPAVEGHYSYYTYVNNAGEEIRYFDTIKRDADGNPYFTYTERNVFNLIYHPEIKAKDEYFSYIDPDTGEEKVYEGSLLKRGAKYFGIIEK